MPSAHEQAAEIVAQQQAARARHVGGVSWGGLTTPLAEVETVEAVTARIEADEARAQAFRRTPRGRFLTCIDELEEVGCLAEAAQLHVLYGSSITLLNGPVADQAAVGKAIIILNGIATRTAREGIDALAELLVAAPLAKAA